jgi:hypothetical protein
MSLGKIRAAIEAMERYEGTEPYTQEAIKLVLDALVPLHNKCIEHDKAIKKLLRAQKKVL